MSSFAYYRLPHERHYTVVRQTYGEPLELLSCDELNGISGFVFAPFMPSPQTPVIVLSPDVVKREQLTDNPVDASIEDDMSLDNQAEREHYAADFANFHARLEEGRFRKIVLARCSEVKVEDTRPLTDMFVDACLRYPRMFIALVSCDRCGTWLMATPEILLDESEGSWHTMALAGTMKLEGEQLGFDNPIGSKKSVPAWSDKNIQEQRYVASYIAECLEQFSDSVIEDGPYTSRAGDLVHLRSDFTFTLSDTHHIGNIIDALYPTPAVCGIPKDDARRFIIDNEFAPRRYYSGFVGPLGIEQGTHLYVSLRCMEIVSGAYRLYAGGGLLCDSEEQQEWNETEAKLDTMRSLIK